MNTLKRIAVVGNPNCGKSALFNSLTGLRQKVANYPGATVEKRSGSLIGSQNIELIDLPGAYSLNAKSPDEAVTRDILKGTFTGEHKPDGIIAVVDATNLHQHLRFVLELQHMQIPMILALNMTDIAASEQVIIDAGKLSEALDIPVVETIATKRRGLTALTRALLDMSDGKIPAPAPHTGSTELKTTQKAAQSIAHGVTISSGIGPRLSRSIDRFVLHPILGPLFLFSIMFLMFQAVYAWAETPMDWIDGLIAGAQDIVNTRLSAGPFQAFLSEGLLGGVGAVIVFLPQIVILFAFILALESTGYMARAAYLMDRLMANVGLSGRAFIPLLSSFACAVPGIMAARAIASPRDRLITILIAPLMTCSARLPVYTVIIAAFIPNTRLLGGLFGLQGIVMFGLYLAGVISALLIAWVFKRTIAQGHSQPFMMELPKYQKPNLRFIVTGLVERTRIFLKRAGTIIFLSILILWVLASFPPAPVDADNPAIHYSLVGYIGRFLEIIFAPIGFNWEISVALVPGMAAREVAIAALGTVYSMTGSEEAVSAGLVSMLNSAWSLPTALSFLAWFVYAPQCLSTIAITRRETNSWRWPLFMVAYLFGLAYLVAFITYQTAHLLMG